MTLLYPNQTIASRWGTGRQTRLRQVPMELFLRSRRREFQAGASCSAKNAAAIVVYLTGAGLDAYRAHSAEPFVTEQLALLARAACAMSESITVYVGEPDSWRIAALLSASQLLSSLMSADKSSQAAAAVVRQFECHDEPRSAESNSFGRLAAEAVRCNEDVAVGRVAAMVTRRLFEYGGPRSAARPSLVTYDFGAACNTSAP